MLFILTGDIQTGKTRWLQALVDDLTERGVPVAGVLAPGVWNLIDPDQVVYDKVGIDNVLLPGGERIEFSRRSAPPQTPAELREMLISANPAELRWKVSDDAIARVNAHLRRLTDEQRAALREARAPKDGTGEAVAPADAGTGAASDGAPARPGLLVVDELGRMEISRGEGLRDALTLLACGPTTRFPHAVVVVRDYLVIDVRRMLESAWGPAHVIEPGDAPRLAITSLMTGGEDTRTWQSRARTLHGCVGREALISAGYDIASDHGIAALTIRSVADACGVAVGTVYRHFATKSDLTVAVIERYFERTLRPEFCEANPQEDYVSYAMRMRDALRGVLDDFRASWLRDSDAIPPAELVAARERETHWMRHIQRGLAYVFDRDEGIDRDAIPDAMTSGDVADMTLAAVLDDLYGRCNAEVLLWAMRHSMYRDVTGASEAGAPEASGE
ncbi:MAG: TetR/AcrR family transcriptional regulator [Coriobacteriales bacterium]